MDEYYKKWITNCSADMAFEILMSYCARYPDRFFVIDGPHAAPPITTIISLGDGNYEPHTSKGYSVEELEGYGYRAVYECFGVNVKVD
jgi:hypothetical protein